MKRQVVFSSAVAVAAALLVGGPLVADSQLESEPGYVPLEHMGILEPGDVTVEVNLRGAILEMVAAFAGEADPEFSDLVKGLKAVTVRTGEIDLSDSGEVQARIAKGIAWLDGNGWLPIVKVKEDEEQIYVYTRETGGLIVGIAVIAFEGTEATAVNLVGSIDPAQVGRLARGLDIDVLADVDMRITTPSSEEDDAEEDKEDE